jgi:hypothetical protein
VLGFVSKLSGRRETVLRRILVTGSRRPRQRPP